jgi:hypothetical protein
MAVTVNAPLDKPVVTPTLTADGSLAQNTTYYVRVMANTNSDLRYASRSRVSDEVNFITDTTNLSASLSWTAPTGATNYWVYVSTVSGSYFSKCQQAYNSGITATTYNLTSINNQTHPYNDGCIIWNRPDSEIPTGITKENGRLTVDFTGTTTLKDIYDAIVAAGYSENCTYDGQNFVLYGSFSLTGSTTTTMTQYAKCLTFLEGTIAGANANATLTFGVVNSTTWAGTSGCAFFLPNSANHLYGFTYGTLNLYGCKLSGLGGYFSATNYSIPYIGINATTPTVNLTGSILTNFAIFVTKKSLSDLVISGCDYEVYANQTRLEVRSGRMVVYGSGLTLTDCIIRNGTGSGWSGSDYQVANVAVYPISVNPSFPNRTDSIPKIWCQSGAYMDFYFNLSLTVQTISGTAISGATVTIVDKNGSAISGSPFTTDANGNIAPNIYSYKIGRNAASWEQDDYKTDYSPHTVTISKSGYITKVIKYTMDRKREEIEVLEKVKQLNYSKYARLFIH